MQPGRLQAAQYEMIRSLIIGRDDRCRQCGGRGHFAQSCSLPPQPWMQTLNTLIDVAYNQRGRGNRINTQNTERSCFRCGRHSHWVGDCHARTHATGHLLQTDNNETCFRCGRQGHWADECYAHTHIRSRARFRPY